MGASRRPLPRSWGCASARDEREKVEKHIHTSQTDPRSTRRKHPRGGRSGRSTRLTHLFVRKLGGGDDALFRLEPWYVFDQLELEVGSALPIHREARSEPRFHGPSF